MPSIARAALVGATLVLTLLVSSASAMPPASTTVYVDCAAAPGGDGRKQSPFPTITAAVPVAKNLSTQRQVTISVATGICEQEILPIQLDFPVDVRGSRAPDTDSEGFPLGSQDRDTVVTWTPPSPVPASVANLAFFRITAPDVRVSKLSVDGKIVPGTPGTPAPARPAPAAFLVQHANDFVIDQLRIVRTGNSVRTQGNASGRIRDTYFGTVGGGIALSGGDPAAPPTVIAENNRIEDFWTGGFAVIGAGALGRSIRAVIEGNDVVTTYAKTGPNVPFGVRVQPILTGTTFLSGTVEATVGSNRFRGVPSSVFILNGGQTVLRADGQRYSGVLDVTFANNQVDPPAGTVATSSISYTNARATELPCELDPANTLAECPTLMGNPLQYWDYLQGSVFDLHHTGELDGALIDHPEIQPVDGHVLNNVLRINDQVIPNQTFVVVP